MIMSWGGFSFDDNECWFEVHKKPVLSRINKRQFVRERWVITGTRHGANTAAIVSKIQAVENAVANDYRDLTFSSGHQLLNANTISGCKVEQFEWLSGIEYGDPGSGVELVMRRTWRLIITGDVLDSEHDILEWYESVRTVGTGGLRWIMMGSLTGPVQIQEVQLWTPYLTIQSGFGKGHLAYPVPATPIWPSFEHVERRDIQYGTPEFHTNYNTDWAVRWRYVFESAAALTGTPTFF